MTRGSAARAHDRLAALLRRLIPSGSAAAATLAFGDIDNDGLPEIVAVYIDNNKTDGANASQFYRESGAIAEHDLDADDDAEIVFNHELYDHESKLLWEKVNPMPGELEATTAVDLDGDSKLEVITVHSDYDSPPLRDWSSEVRARIPPRYGQSDYWWTTSIPKDYEQDDEYPAQGTQWWTRHTGTGTDMTTTDDLSNGTAWCEVFSNVLMRRDRAIAAWFAHVRTLLSESEQQVLVLAQSCMTRSEVEEHLGGPEVVERGIRAVIGALESFDGPGDRATQLGMRAVRAGLARLPVFADQFPRGPRHSLPALLLEQLERREGTA